MKLALFFGVIGLSLIGIFIGLVVSNFSKSAKLKMSGMIIFIISFICLLVDVASCLIMGIR